jgi:hypothetical protein
LSKNRTKGRVMKKFMVADLVKSIKEDAIEYLLKQVELGQIGIDEAQEKAWEIHGYPGDSQRSQTSSHAASHGTLFGGSSESTITVTYEPIFESLGPELDDTPYWEVYVTIRTEGDYPHFYEGSAENKELEAIEALEETGSVMRWFNEYCGDHRYK